ncbi:hypothetical protein [Hymenobacter terrestris]|uniref:DUF4843 domain-containing protein n=1 Tax=Hymenobacter terrestris TaxID=2748310 RepID=A0ABX2Q2F1_9BACT|nr:hypothetical protein [Hymenobacter terrestris]NVO84714.1 hypothetical protein [Hymenobacter terrestris]
MKSSTLTSLCALMFCTSCLTSEEPPLVEYRFTAEQLAWQPYRTGDVLRFGNDHNNRIRTYKIPEIVDVMEEMSTGSVYIPLPVRRQTAVLVQRIAVRMQRTDSVTSRIPLLNLQLSYNPDRKAPSLIFSELSWEGFYKATLPIDSVNGGKPINQRYYQGVSLLPTLTVGPTTYQQVLVAENSYPQLTLPGVRLVSRLYYARQRGVVGFVEGGTLWYKLP